ncbi:glycosyl hydrolase family 28-related protein [Sphingomonas cavernae]|uniref:Rhamnogalacturonase A/B/Epimerase-like pectate lyase domain-containing protein n=1 Tax=Sphingomonas cavernae TaxID=2320861 RepID=A0A418W756_9SPHN|nr:glycosyl hydrolase family 28-related protein [Sphingomonas cavernae]RJF85797.1 hypothetical protein D3876_18145 [Sphingomonas cavernae]
MVDVTKEELIAASGASLVGFKQNTTVASTRTVEAKLREAVSVRDYGAVGDGSTDDSDAINAAIASALTIGGTLFFPKGFYRVVRTLNIGLQVYTNYQQPIDSIGWEGCSLNTANKAANASKKRLDVVGEAGAVIIGDFTTTAPTPIIAYNLDNDTLEETGSIRNLTVITANQFSSGKITPTAYDGNNLIGLFTGRGAKIVDKINYYGCGYGHVSLSSYWCTHQNLEAFNCGRGFTFTEMNAGLHNS